MRFSLPLIAALSFCFACGTADKKITNLAAKNATPVPQVLTDQPEIKDGDYFGTGKITKVKVDMPSVELDHEDIPGLMPAMLMEFYVSDKALLNPLAVGDRVAFTILYKGGTETITKIGKTK